MKPTRKTRGLTLVEVLVTTALLGVLLYFGLQLQFQAQIQSKDVQGLAQKVKGFIELTRQEAKSSGIPCAVAFPTDADHPACQSVYMLMGERYPRIVRDFTWKNEHSHDYLYPSLLPGVGLATAAPSRVGQSEFDWNDYHPPVSAHALLVCLPNGEVHAQGLPYGAGHFQLFFAQSAQISPLQSVGGHAFFQATAWSKAASVKIHPLGSVLWSQIADLGQATSVPAVAGDVTLSGMQGSAPQVADLKLWPDPKTIPLPSGTDALIAADSFLSMQIEVQLPEQSPMWTGPYTCEWTCTGGRLSSAAPTNLRYQTQSKRWINQWQWTPPANANDGDRFKLNCVIRDGLGHEVRDDRRCALDLTVSRKPAKVAYIQDRAGRSLLHTKSADGAGERLLTLSPNGTHDRVASWSPDGTKILTVSNRTGFDELHLVMADGSSTIFLTKNHPNSYKGYPEFSPLGTKIAFTYQPQNSPHDVAVMNADGSNFRNLTQTNNADEILPIFRDNNYLAGSWSPDENYLLMTSGNQILIADLRTSNPPNVLVSSPPPSLIRIDHPCFSHKADSNGKFWIVFTGYSNAGSNIWKVRPDGTQLQQVTNSNTASFPRWSPDDTKLCYLSPDGSGTDQIVSCGADGSNPMIHTNDAYYKTAVDWLDASTISFVSNQANNQEIFTVDVNANQIINLTKNGFDDYFFGWVK